MPIYMMPSCIYVKPLVCEAVIKVIVIDTFSVFGIYEYIDFGHQVQRARTFLLFASLFIQGRKTHMRATSGYAKVVAVLTKARKCSR